MFCIKPTFFVLYLCRPPISHQTPIHNRRWFLLPLSFLPPADDLGGPHEPAVLPGPVSVPALSAPRGPSLHHRPDLPPYGVRSALKSASLKQPMRISFTGITKTEI